MGCCWRDSFLVLVLNALTASVPATQNAAYSSDLLWCILPTLSKNVFSMCQSSIDCIIACFGVGE